MYTSRNCSYEYGVRQRNISKRYLRTTNVLCASQKLFVCIITSGLGKWVAKSNLKFVVQFAACAAQHHSTCCTYSPIVCCFSSSAFYRKHLTMQCHRNAKVTKLRKLERNGERKKMSTRMKVIGEMEVSSSENEIKNFKCCFAFIFSPLCFALNKPISSFIKRP